MSKRKKLMTISLFQNWSGEAGMIGMRLAEIFAPEGRQKVELARRLRQTSERNGRTFRNSYVDTRGGGGWRRRLDR